MNETKKCTQCEEERELSCYYRKSNNKLVSQCKNCMREKQKHYRGNKVLYKKAKPEEKLNILQDVWKEMNDKLNRGVL